MAATDSTPTPATSGHVEANGVHYYYEVHGEGEPLLLLHGGLGSIDMFGPLLPMLAEHRQVIGVDLHGHGRTALGDRPINLIDMGDDMAAILKHLGYRAGRRARLLPRRRRRLSGSRCSTRRWSAAWCWSRPASPRTASIPRCCRCRRRSAPAWPR